MQSSHSDEDNYYPTKVKSPNRPRSPNFKRSTYQEDEHSPHNLPHSKSNHFDKYRPSSIGRKDRSPEVSPRSGRDDNSPHQQHYPKSSYSGKYHPSPGKRKYQPPEVSHRSYSEQQSKPRVYSRSPSPQEYKDSHYHSAASPTQSARPSRSRHNYEDITHPHSPSYSSNHFEDPRDYTENYATRQYHTSNNGRNSYHNHLHNNENHFSKKPSHQTTDTPNKTNNTKYHEPSHPPSSAKVNYQPNQYSSYNTHPNNHAEDNHYHRSPPHSPRCREQPRKSSVEHNGFVDHHSNPTISETAKDERIRKLEEEMAVLRKALEQLSNGKAEAQQSNNLSSLPRAPSLNTMRMAAPVYARRMDAQFTTENRNDTSRPHPNFYEVPDDNSVDSEEEIAFFEPPAATQSGNPTLAAPPPAIYKYGTSSRANSGFGSVDIETESGEAESTLASRTLEEKIQGLRM